MRFFKLGFIILLVLFTGVLRLNAADIPDWITGYWWDLNTDWAGDFNGSAPAEITFHELNCRHSVTAISTRSLTHGAQNSFSVYVLNFTGLLYGEGVVHLDGGPFPIDLDIRIPDTQVSGELLIDTETLGIVSRNRTFSGNIEAHLGGNWEPVGNMHLDVTTEWDPPRDICHFPLEVGDAWNDAFTTYWFGNYYFYLEVLSEPTEEDVDFDLSQAQLFSAEALNTEVKNGYESIRISYLDSTGRPETAWYSPDAEWVVGMEGFRTGSTDDFFIPAWDENMGEHGTEPATPLPTRTPVPPTATPTQLPPTEPPPTVTGTPPTPTPTYTLPPWIPPTSTPGIPTPTPEPPDDRLSIQIYLNQFTYHSGDDFLFTTTITNPLANGFIVMEYIILQYGNDFWFWPSWQNSVDGKIRLISANSSIPDETILEFIWPDIPEIPGELTLWAAMTEPGTFEIIGEFTSANFRYE